MSKSRDVSAVRGYMTNLMYYTKPSRQRQIDVMDFIYREIETGTLLKRTPAYAPLIQKFLNRVCGETIMQCREMVELELFAPVFTSGPPIREHAKGKGQQDDAGPSSSHAPAPKRSNRSAISKFLQAMFSTCRDARAYSHEAKELAKEGRCIQNADRRAAG